MELQHLAWLSDRASRTMDRQLAVGRMRATFEELNAELKGSSGLRWAIGAPFARLDRARGVLDGFGHVLGSAERTELDRVIRDYGRAFDAMPDRHRRSHPDTIGAIGSLAVERLVNETALAAASLCDAMSARG